MYTQLKGLYRLWDVIVFVMNCNITLENKLELSILCKFYMIKVRLRWLGAVLQYPCKLIVFLSSLNISTRVTYDKVAKE